MTERSGGLRLRRTETDVVLSSGLWATAAVIATVVAFRRLSGGVTSELPEWAACLVCSIAAGTTVAASRLSTLNSRLSTLNGLHGGSTGLLLPAVLALLPPIALAAALLPRPSGGAIGYLAGMCLAVLAGVSLKGGRLRGAARSAQAASTPSDEKRVDGKRPAWGSDLVSWNTRRVQEGHDCGEGAVTVHFARGQKQATVHLPFCPPFETPPHVRCTAEGEGGFRTKVAAVHAYGARIEVRRSRSVETEARVRITFMAETPPRDRPKAA